MTTAADEVRTLDEEWPETPTINIRVSVQLLKEWAGEGRGIAYPRGIRLVSLGKPDAEGFYEPVLEAVYDEPERESYDAGDYK